MLRLFRNAALSALVALGALSSAAAPALAQSGGLYLNFGSGPSGFSFDDRGRHDFRGRDHDRRDRNRDRRDRRDHDRRDRDGRGFCSPREAVHKASRMGLRGARVVASNHRVVRVEGRRHSSRNYIITFRNADNCPVLR